MQNYTNEEGAPPADGDGAGQDMNQYLDFNDLGFDGFSGPQIPFTDIDQQGQPDLESILNGMGPPVTEDATSPSNGHLGSATNPSTVAASPGSSSVGSRAREELDEEVEEVSPKRRRVA